MPSRQKRGLMLHWRGVLMVYKKTKQKKRGFAEVKRWRGIEYKMLLKEIEIRAIRWCRLAVCVNTHQALAPGRCRACVKSKSNWMEGEHPPARMHCPQQLRGIWSTNHTALEVLLFQSEAVSVYVWKHIGFMGQFAQSGVSLQIPLELKWCFMCVFTVETSGLLVFDDAGAFFWRIRVSDFKIINQI